MKLFRPGLRLGSLVLSLLGCAAKPPEAEPQTISPEAVTIDVRTQAEYDAGHIEGALLIPYDVIGQRIESAVPDRSRQIVVYCRTGRRSGIAQQTLQELGYTDVVNAGSLAEARQRLGR